jgi:hypothetical protein
MTQLKTLTIIIACFNESGTILGLLKKIDRASCFGLKKEIIVINDGSTDDTKNILNRNKKGIKIFHHARNLGKGASVKTGIRYSSGDILIIQDADLEYDPSEYELLIGPILRGEADVVYGSRFMGDRPHRVLYFWHAITNQFLTFLSNMLTNINLTDMETGYKAFSGDLIRKVSRQLISDDFGFEPEVTARLAKIPGIKFYEVGISYYGRTYAEGKHIGWYDGFKAIWQIIWFNIISR